MSAITPFWTCGNCGFVNKPHAFRQGDETNKKCEQCGAGRDHPDAYDDQGATDGR